LLSVKTDNTGLYAFTLQPVGDYDVTAEMEGYSSQTKPVTVVPDTISWLDFALIPGGQLGFLMQVVDNLNQYPTAEFWYAEIEELINWFIPITSVWDERSVDLNEHISWPATLTVELYDADLNLIVRRVITVERMLNGHFYTFYMDRLPHLVDEGTY
jgi:hypothetical protein